MVRKTMRSALLVGLILTCGACLSGGDDVEPNHYYKVVIPRLSAEPDPVPVTVVLRTFNVDELLDREGILYQTTDVERGYWVSHQWIEPVAGMLRSALQQDLVSSGRFAAVYLLENESLADVIVNAQVHEFGEVDARGGWYGVVDVTFAVNRMRDGEVIWQKRVRLEEKANERTVVETVRALGRALGRASDELKAGILAGVQ